MAGAMLFRGEQVKKHISVLSGGERARLCMTGLLLSHYNILVLDEPGNHLDVDTVEALAEALIDYKGTVVFTSHDRHFMKRVATCIIEVRDGRVTNYRGDYEAYLYSVNKEIEEGEREQAAKAASAPPSSSKATGSKPTDKTPKPAPRAPRRSEREVRKEITNLERTIARLDDQKRQVNSRLLQSTDAAEALRLHNEVQALTTQLADAEERWCRLQEEIEEPQ
jgi:ATP-binding cassette subfamily F protein 3